MPILTKSAYLIIPPANGVQPMWVGFGVWTALAKHSFVTPVALRFIPPCLFTLLRSGLECFSKKHP